MHVPVQEHGRDTALICSRVDVHVCGTCHGNGTIQNKVHLCSPKRVLYHMLRMPQFKIDGNART